MYVNTLDIVLYTRRKHVLPIRPVVTVSFTIRPFEPHRRILRLARIHVQPKALFREIRSCMVQRCTSTDYGNFNVHLLRDEVLTIFSNATILIIYGKDLGRISVFTTSPIIGTIPLEYINVIVVHICLEAINGSPYAPLATAKYSNFVVNVTAPYRIANQVPLTAF